MKKEINDIINKPIVLYFGLTIFPSIRATVGIATPAFWANSVCDQPKAARPVLIAIEKVLVLSKLALL